MYRDIKVYIVRASGTITSSEHFFPFWVIKILLEKYVSWLKHVFSRSETLTLFCRV